MSVTTLLKKEKEGTLFKEAENPMNSPVLRAFSDELQKIANALPEAVNPGLLRRAGEFLVNNENPIEVAGLGILGGIGADRLQAHARAGADASEEDIEHKQLMGETGHAAADTVGLGVLAAPLLAARAIKGHWGH